VELGTDYGLPVAGDYGQPSKKEAIAILRRAAEAGVNLFDTAPGYGQSEKLIGEALAHDKDALVATKVEIPRDEEGRPLTGPALSRVIADSLAASRCRLRRDVLDIVQIQNATEEVINRGEVAGALVEARRRGELRFLGASVYTVWEALAVIRAGGFDLLQVAYSVLDQRMAEEVFAAAERAGVGLLLRSALLKGALTRKAESLPDSLSELATAARRARNTLAGGSWAILTGLALRFCLSAKPAAAVLIGARTTTELDQALEAAEAGGLPAEGLALGRDLALTDEHLLNPSFWPGKQNWLERRGRPGAKSKAESSI